jgi:hypothetical protein
VALLSVRLESDDARRVVELRRAGVHISSIVRQAIRTEHERRLGKHPSGRSVAMLLERIYADHPDTPDVERRGYDLRDRQAARATLQKRSRKRRA